MLVVKIGFGFLKLPRFLRQELLTPFPGELSLTFVFGLKNKEETQDISGKQHQTDLERLCRGCGRGGRGRYLSDVGKPGLGAVGEIGGSQVA